jgi:spore coat polysaccharide biosynthesis protein SpsF
MNHQRKLVATIACRNQGSRLYGKPLQHLDVSHGVRIIDNIIECIQAGTKVDEIVLAISDGIENQIFTDVANKYGLKYIIGDEHDVLQRLISAAEAVKGTDIFRVTSESPFMYFEPVDDMTQRFYSEELDALFVEPIIDGCGFEIIKLDALKKSHFNGSARHRSEMCTLYIRENSSDFNIARIAPPLPLQRFDLRLTVDNPEDLTVCRHIYSSLKSMAPLFLVSEIVEFLDRNPSLIELTAPFTETGYSTMYL